MEKETCLAVDGAVLPIVELVDVAGGQELDAPWNEALVFNHYEDRSATADTVRLRNGNKSLGAAQVRASVAPQGCIIPVYLFRHRRMWPL